MKCQGVGAVRVRIYRSMFSARVRALLLYNFAKSSASASSYAEGHVNVNGLTFTLHHSQSDRILGICNVEKLHSCSTNNNMVVIISLINNTKV